MNLDIYRSMWGLVKPLEISEVLKTNQESVKYGLVLSDIAALELIEARNRAIRNHGRVELGIDVVKKIITAFCSSPYINTEEYALILSELVEIFYYMKNETEDRIGDDELIALMKDFFNNSCEGSMEILYKELTSLAENIKQRKYVSGNALEGGRG